MTIYVHKENRRLIVEAQLLSEDAVIQSSQYGRILVSAGNYRLRPYQVKTDVFDFGCSAEDFETQYVEWDGVVLPPTDGDEGTENDEEFEPQLEEEFDGDE